MTPACHPSLPFFQITVTSTVYGSFERPRVTVIVTLQVPAFRAIRLFTMDAKLQKWQAGVAG